MFLEVGIKLLLNIFKTCSYLCYLFFCLWIMIITYFNGLILNNSSNKESLFSFRVATTLWESFLIYEKRNFHLIIAKVGIYPLSIEVFKYHFLEHFY